MTKSRISIAIAALGGQGGGVLSNWIVDLGQANGYIAQYTAIAGVAQRTGTTIYCVELFPKKLAQEEGKDPVLALMPVVGDVDICLAAELMEAGRAVNRGMVTPDKTTLIASDHRVYAISEKQDMADGRLKSEDVRTILKKAAKKLVLFDMDDAVLRSSSVISSVLFGALAGSDAMPFTRQMFEETIKNSGRAVEANLMGFALGYQYAKGDISKPAPVPCASKKISSPIMSRIEKLPEQSQALATYGVHRLVDYQNAKYASLYLDRLEEITNLDILPEVARQLALWMGFDDIIRVADLKTRAERAQNIISEVRAEPSQIWQVEDYFHPRFEEFTDILPAALGRSVLNSSICKKMFAPLFSKGRIIKTRTICGYLMLRFIASMRFLRLKSLRYHNENKNIIAWFDQLKKNMIERPDLALEIAKCPRLIKGYGETHGRGLYHYLTIMVFVDQHQDDAMLTSKVAGLREAALMNADGIEFKARLREYS